MKIWGSILVLPKVITDLKNRLYYPLGIYNNIFHSVARQEMMKNWDNLTFTSFISFSIWLATKYKPYKRENAKGFPFLISLLLCAYRCLLRFSILLFPNNMEGSKRTTTRSGHLSSSTEKKQNQTCRKIQTYHRKFAVKQYFKSL